MALVVPPAKAMVLFTEPVTLASVMTYVLTPELRNSLQAWATG